MRIIALSDASAIRGILLDLGEPSAAACIAPTPVRHDGTCPMRDRVK